MSCMLITRADDAGSSHAANQAILEAIKTGFIRNVSVMAVGPYLEEFAAALKKETDICLGLHAVLNSEWDTVKWKPACPPEQIPSLLDKTGSFYQRPALFPSDLSLQEMLLELDGQLERLHQLGLRPAYVDSHMYFERQSPKLQSAFSQWAGENGLIDHRHFCQRFPLPQTDDPLAQRMKKAAQDASSPDPYLHIFHPACPVDEMLQFGHEGMPPERVRSTRGEEYHFIADGTAEQLCRQYQISPISYRQAAALLQNP